MLLFVCSKAQAQAQAHARSQFSVLLYKAPPILVANTRHTPPSSTWTALLLFCTNSSSQHQEWDCRIFERKLERELHGCSSARIRMKMMEPTTGCGVKVAVELGSSRAVELLLVGAHGRSSTAAQQRETRRRCSSPFEELRWVGRP